MRAAGVYYILRPEAVETMFYMWRLTKDPKWRDYGWTIFEAINKNCKTQAGFAYVKEGGKGNDFVVMILQGRPRCHSTIERSGP